MLCAGHGLKHHTQYLHGWGIVSGLKVVCEPADREQGAHPPGLGDRPGRERHRDPGDPASVPRARRGVRRRSGQRHQDPQERDRGRLELFMEPGPRNRRRALRGRAVQLGLEEGAERPAQPDAPWSSRGLHRRRASLLRAGADASPGTEIIRPARSRSGWRRSPTSSCSVSTRRRADVLLTPREHAILAEFYEGLKNELSLETFCGLFDDARPFPGRPSPAASQGWTRSSGAASTSGSGSGLAGTRRTPSDRASARPSRRRPSTAGISRAASSSRSSTLRGQDEGQHGMSSVLDVALSPDGKKIYAVASTRTRRTRSSASGRSARGHQVWRRLHHLRPQDRHARDDRRRQGQGLRDRPQASGHDVQEDERRRALPHRPGRARGRDEPVLVGANFDSIGHLRSTRRPARPGRARARPGPRPRSTPASACSRTSPSRRRP